MEQQDPKSQSSFNRRNKSSSSSSSSFSTRSGLTKTGAAASSSSDSSHRSSSTWLQGRMRLFLFSFLFAFVPVLMHFRKRSQNQDTAKWHAKKGSDGISSGTAIRDKSMDDDTSSTSSSENESSDEPAVQATYQQILASEVEVLFFKLLPLKLISRIWGWINSLPLPEWVRIRIISWYSRVFECDLTEADKDDLSEYANLGDFFKRQLKPGCRPIDPHGDIVSPSDGTVVHFGQIDEQHVEQVKGVKYSLPAFLGPQSWVKQRTNNSSKNNGNEIENGNSNNQDLEYHQKLISRPGNALYHCVIYLAPGDYHRFHSPADWTVRFRRHFSGKLISIRPTFMSWIEDLFTINERVAYIGKWAYGFFSMTAVGATNVGSVRVYFDEKLKTNQFLSFPGSFKDQKIHSVSRIKGNAFGEFNLGSTIVLIFEAPAEMECNVCPGQKIRYGQKLFSINRNKG